MFILSSDFVNLNPFCACLVASVWRRCEEGHLNRRGQAPEFADQRVSPGLCRPELRISSRVALHLGCTSRTPRLLAGALQNRDLGSVTRNVGCPDGMDSPYRRRLVRDGLRHAPDAQPRAHTAVAAAGCAASTMISFGLLTVAPRDLLVGPACAGAETGEWRDGRNGACG
jgi:hypothetical protein